jgi:succinate dehydrogenase / fumarate reductase membrane anchor subunit
MDGALKTPLKNVRGLGSAKSGTEHFWHQRLTAIANLPLIAGVVWFIVLHLGASRAEVIASLKNPLLALLLVLAMASVTWHMRLGLQVVIEDYLHSPARKFFFLLLNSAFAILMFAVAAYSILKMSFGS